MSTSKNISDIQVKRSTKSVSELIGKTLNPGEPLYLNNVNGQYILMGGGQIDSDSSQAINQSKAVKLLDQQYAKYPINLESSDMSSTVQLKQEATNIFPKLKDFGTYVVSASSTFYTINNDGSKGSATSDTTIPVMCSIPVTGMTSDTKPEVALVISSTEKNNALNIKSRKKAFGYLTGVFSDTGTIWLSFIKKPAADFRISIKGV